MQMTKPQTISAEEYFEVERTSETKHEYLHGGVFAMPGASVRYNLLVSNAISALDRALGEIDCEIFPGDIKVELEFDKHYVYPDFTAIIAVALSTVVFGYQGRSCDNALKRLCPGDQRTTSATKQ